MSYSVAAARKLLVAMWAPCELWNAPNAAIARMRSARKFSLRVERQIGLGTVSRAWLSLTNASERVAIQWTDLPSSWPPRARRDIR